jgi:hypothetical protein
MAITILRAFDDFKSNLEITDLQQSTVSTRQNGVRDALKNELVVIDDFLTGSYSKSTLISPLNKADIDIFTVLDSKYYYNYNGQNGGQAGLLDLVKRALIKTYPKTPNISRNGQAITITFNDFIVDVVPAFKRNGGGYLIPNSKSQTWIATDPTQHVNFMAAHNKARGGMLVPAVKMIKCWNRNINNAFVSFYLELLAASIFNNIKITDFPSGMRYFFDKGRESIKFTIKDPVEFGGQINGLNNCDTVENAVKKFETAYKIAIKAEQGASSSIKNAIDEWKKIFGDYFPSFG